MDELLDLVNEKDEVIGEVLRSEAHKNNKLIHREAGVILYRENQLMLQKRSRNKLKFSGFWTITCAGHVTKGLAPIEVAHKELMEELGFDVKDLKLIKKKFVLQDSEAKFAYCYFGKYDNQTIKIDENEVEEIKMFTMPEIELMASNGQITLGSLEWCRDLSKLIELEHG